MNSKEALELAILDSEQDLRDDIYDNKWVESVLQGLKDCQRALEVLEILKKHSTRLDDEDWDSNIFNGIDYENLDEEERKVIKEWLESE